MLEICVRTGDAGADATGLHADPRVLTDRWAAPYLDLEPEHAWVAELDGTVVGYLLGASDTHGFARRFAEHPSSLTVAERESHADGLRADAPEAYPAHLHVDILPGAQGRGVGRMLIEAFLAQLAAEGVPGVHLGVDPRNTGALAFYPRVGFRPASEALFVRATR